VIGVGVTKFGLHDRTSAELFAEAAQDALTDAGVPATAIQALYYGNVVGGETEHQLHTGPQAASVLGIPSVPTTRFETACASSHAAFRHAVMEIAAGVSDVILVGGAERVLNVTTEESTEYFAYASDAGWEQTLGLTFPGVFALVARAHMAKYGTTEAQMAAVAVKNHKHATLNPKAQFQKEVPMDVIRNSPKIADPLGIMDCSGVSDGSAAAIVVRAEDAPKYCKNPIYIKALSFVAGPAEGPLRQEYDFTTFPEVVATATDAYKQAGITNPREQVSLAEVHDCFTPTELVLYEDLGFSKRGTAWQDVLEGFFDLEGRLPVNPDGGLKSFGHPIGASGLRMMYEMWLQLRGEAGPRQINNPKVGLTHNLGGQPGRCVSFVSVVGSQVG